MQPSVQPSLSAPSDLHHSSWVMLGLLLAFAVIHSGGASLRPWGAERIGERAWRLLFAAVSIPSAVVVIGYFLAHRYDGVRLWNLIGSSFMVAAWAGLIAHHLFAVWNGDRRLAHRFGSAFEELKGSTSVLPFRAVLDGRQQLVLSEFLRPAQLGIAIAVGVFWWAHRFIGTGATAFSRTALAHWLG